MLNRLRHLVVLIVFAVSSTAPAQLQSTEPLDELRQKIARSTGLEQAELRLKFLERNDAPIVERFEVASKLVDEFTGRDEPRILGLALLAKGTTQGQLGDLKKGVEILGEAERPAKLVADEFPEIFFKARSNRALYLVALGNKTEPVGLLHEVIEYAKPYGDKLSVGHAYLTLAMLAENSGATQRAVEYLQTSFDVSTRANQAYIAGAAGETTVALFYSEQQFELAEKWLEKAQPWVDQSGNPGLIFSFAMRREEVRIARGELATAADNLRRLAQSSQPNIEVQMVGLVYLALSSAEQQQQHFDAAHDAAREAIARLQSFPRSLYLAEHMRLEALFEKGEYSQIIEEMGPLLEKSSDYLLPSIKLRELYSRTLSKLGRHEEALNELRQGESIEKNRLKERAQEQMSFMTSIFEDKSREQELAVTKQQRLASEANARLADAAAERQTLIARHATTTKNIAIGVSLSALVACVLIVWVLGQSRATRLIAKRERELNDDLNQQLNRQAITLRSEEESRRKLEMAVERKHRDEALGKLTGGVAHDFNNLLTVILNCNEVIHMREPTLAAPLRQLLDSSTTAAQAGADIIRELLSYARQESLTPTLVQVSHWLDSVKVLFRQTVGESVSYSERDLSEGAAISVDAARLTTSVINLLSNAKDAVGPNGSIELVVQKVTLDALNVGEWGDSMTGPFAQFEVRDNGKGIPEDQLPMVCDPFFTTKGSKSGTGLGLSSVLGFARQSRGEFRLVSDLGRGTVAKIILPLCDWKAPTSEAGPRLQSLARKGSVLVVEDQDAVRFATVSMLQMMGFEVAEANNSDAAMRILSTGKPPEIVLSDVRMPGPIDGIGLQRWIHSRHAETRVILMSGFSEIQESVGTEILQKPFTRAELEKALIKKSA